MGFPLGYTINDLIADLRVHNERVNNLQKVVHYYFDKCFDENNEMAIELWKSVHYTVNTGCLGYEVENSKLKEENEPTMKNLLVENNHEAWAKEKLIQLNLTRDKIVLREHEIRLLRHKYSSASEKEWEHVKSHIEEEEKWIEQLEENYEYQSKLFFDELKAMILTSINKSSVEV